MRISDWSSDVCSSDLHLQLRTRQSANQRMHQTVLAPHHQVVALFALFANRDAVAFGVGDVGIGGHHVVRHHGIIDAITHYRTQPAAKKAPPPTLPFRARHRPPPPRDPPTARPPLLPPPPRTTS